ncbi:hypothetical protein [Ralstonia solanacearum]|uniref:hypothetical protein n=1 Tax=Ralstonia solanacearum TaxID=305 RepID=UPI000A106DAD|nr:hypothetical protein [Ralstonia solanacearum]
MAKVKNAAGTLKTARLLVLGARVAGLAANPNGQRLGALVQAFQVAPGVEEQNQSLGGQILHVTFLDEEESQIAQGVGGYSPPKPPEWMGPQANWWTNTPRRAKLSFTPG